MRGLDPTYAKEGLTASRVQDSPKLSATTVGTPPVSSIKLSRHGRRTARGTRLVNDDPLSAGGNVPSDLLGELIIRPLMEFGCYWTGKPIIVRLLSLGKLHVALVEPHRRGKRQRKWYSLTFTRGGRRYLDAEAAMLVGMVFWALVITAVVLIVRTS